MNSSSPDLTPSTDIPPETDAAPVTRQPLDYLLAPKEGWFRALRHPEFRVFWAGNFASNIGTWMQNVAQGWLVLQITNSPFWLGAIGFAQQMPALIFSLPGGVVADRVGRRNLLFTTQSIMTVLALVMAVLTSLGWISVGKIAAIAFLAGTTMAINAPSYQAAVRDLVTDEDTLNAIALNSIQFNTSRVLGPSLAGFVIAGFNIEACFYLNALSYVPLLYVIARTKFPERDERPESTMRAELLEGLHYVWANRPILMLIAMVAIVSMFGLPYLVMMPEFARNVLKVGPKGLGYLVAAAGLGALLGGLLLARMPATRKRGPLVLGAAILFFMDVIAFCFSRQPWLSAALLAIAGGTAVNSVATVNSLIQTLVPGHIRGRVLSMHTMAFLGFTPLGSLLVGSLAEKLGAPVAMALSSGFALLLTVVIAATAREVRKLA
jgi:MFS family permease